VVNAPQRILCMLFSLETPASLTGSWGFHSFHFPGQLACAAALEMGVHEYRFVRRYLKRAPQLTLRQVAPLIRELVHYRDLINLRTQESEDEPPTCVLLNCFDGFRKFFQPVQAGDENALHPANSAARSAPLPKKARQGPPR